MTTITVTGILNKCAVLLYDVNNIKWSRLELLTYFNSAQRTLVASIPESSATWSVFSVAAGTRQQLPAGSNMLLDVTRNLGTGGLTPGRAVKRVDMIILDESNPTWSSDPASAVTALFMYNLRDRYAFNVYPPAPGGTSLEIITSVIPVDIVEGTGNLITLGDLFEPALIDYILWRAYSKSAPFSDDPTKTAMYIKSFAGFIQAFTGDSGKLAAEMGQLAALSPQGQGVAGGSG